MMDIQNVSIYNKIKKLDLLGLMIDYLCVPEQIRLLNVDNKFRIATLSKSSDQILINSYFIIWREIKKKSSKKGKGKLKKTFFKNLDYVQDKILAHKRDENIRELDSEKLLNLIYCKGLDFLSENTQLDLRGNKIGDDGAKAIGVALEKNSTLKEIDLSYNNIGFDIILILEKKYPKIKV